MAPPLLFDHHEYDLTQVAVTREEIYDFLPHRYEFMLLDGAVMLDTQAQRMIAFADIKEDAWWTRGHIPSKPIMPGVLWIEMAGQAAAYYSQKVLGYDGFLAFTAVDDCKFRGATEPPCRAYLLGVEVDMRPRRCICTFQAVVNDKMVFEARLTGIPLNRSTLQKT
jgi:3-hydroxyacyl-[acyl-carrier-protein] dehydratase